VKFSYTVPHLNSCSIWTALLHIQKFPTSREGGVRSKLKKAWNYMYIPGFFIPNPDIKIFVDEKEIYKWDLHLFWVEDICCMRSKKVISEYNPHAPQRRIGYTREGGLMNGWRKRERKNTHNSLRLSFQ
jgi:hypothetical protein